jgi:hypothetical protein
MNTTHPNGQLTARHHTLTRIGFFALVMLLCGLASAAVGTEGGDPPPCGQDGICNMAACSNDPDCPAGVGNDNTNYSTTGSALKAVTNCNATREQDIRAVAWNIADDWSNFTAAIQLTTSFKVKECLHDRFSKNGKVLCEDKDHCSKNKGCRQGHSFPGKHEIKIYPDFLKRISGYSQADRRACYAALLAHEFTHSCAHLEGRAEAREDAAFSYWQSRFPGTPGFNINDENSGCGLD